MINLNLLSWQNQLQIKQVDNQPLIFDSIRRQWLVLQPEEMVRQLLIQYLLHAKGYRRGQIAVERQLLVNGLTRRFDLLIYAADARPFLLAECKAPHVEITNATFWQVARYNLPLQVPFLLVTNGKITYCCRLDYERQAYEFLTEVPDA